MFILFYLGPNHSSFSSSQQLFTPLPSNDSAGEGGKMHSCNLYFYIFIFFNHWYCFQSFSTEWHLRLSYECTANSLKNAKGEPKWDIQLSTCSVTVTLIRKVSETHTNTRGGTIHVFEPNHHGMDISVRCMRPYNEYRQFTPKPEVGAYSNAKLFDNRQLKNRECHELRTWKQSPQTMC